MWTNLKVGMKVRVRPNLEEKNYGGNDLGAVDEMVERKGQIVTIANIYPTGDDTEFTIVEDNNEWCYNKFMVIPILDDTMQKLKEKMLR